MAIDNHRLNVLESLSLRNIAPLQVRERGVAA